MYGKLILLIVALSTVLVGYGQSAKVLDLANGWEIQVGDQSVYESQAMGNNAWKPVKVGTNWETQGLADYNGIAWYRLRVVIPSSLRERNPPIQGLRLALGKIDDNDRTYLNGREIGRTTGYNEAREYIISYDQIRWDAENVLAVRVDDGAGYGGMMSGPYVLGGSPKLSTMLTLESHQPPTILSGFDKTMVAKSVQFRLAAPVEALTGILRTRVVNTYTKALVFQKTQPMYIGRKAKQTYFYELKLGGEGAYRADYVFKTDTDSVSYSTLIAYHAKPRTGEHLTYPVVAQQVPAKTEAFPLEHIQFSGFLQQRLDANLYQRLLNIDEQGILEGFYNRPGKQTWVGEYPGKYLHAASRVWRYSHSARLKTQMDRVVDILIGTQLENGYLGTYAPKDYWTAWDVWAHKYDMLGLLSYYAATGHQPALETSKRVGDLLIRTFGIGPGQLNIVETGEHVGMASASVLEPMTELYRYTGEKKYLDFCRYILQAYESPKGPKLISTLNTLGRVDKTANGKAYEMLSNLVGIVKLYQLTGEANLLAATEKAWQDIVAYKLYITGTASSHELFQPDGVLPAENKDSMGEGCVTTTWLQFNQLLYALTGEGKYMDEIEKTVYNHLFAAENPQTGCVSYYTALSGKKPYRCTIFAHCCLASVPRGFAITPEFVYTKNRDNGLTINIYSAGQMQDTVVTRNGNKVPLDMVISSRFPAEGRATILLKPARTSSFKLALRVPAWARNFRATVKGKSLTEMPGIAVPGQYLTLEQLWEPNTVIEVTFDLNPQLLDGGASYPGLVALKNGPQVLAIDQSLNPTLTDLRDVTLESAEVVAQLPAQLPKGWVGTQLYKVQGQVGGKPIELIAVPYAEAGQTGADLTVWLRKSN
ncbi:beta-L-arabinofuranosidase domain-containing protein [uncultured Fibrella sp.]|uniref:glycoside hydrolase family 127 protein n=1 Tax=uncultured Fibrella sp. TaxID=1284596 RepID=UPI0035CA2BE0